MTIKISSTNKFNKELELMLKRGKDINKISKIINLIEEGINKNLEHHLILPSRYRLHKLSGGYVGFWECHIEPDWLLIFYLDSKLLELERTGAHSDLFK